MSAAQGSGAIDKQHPTHTHTHTRWEILSNQNLFNNNIKSKLKTTLATKLKGLLVVWHFNYRERSKKKKRDEKWRGKTRDLFCIKKRCLRRPLSTLLSMHWLALLWLPKKCNLNGGTSLIKLKFAAPSPWTPFEMEKNIQG